MHEEDALEGLRARTSRILQIIADGGASLAVADANEWKALALSRWQLMRALADLSAYKQERLLDPIIAAGGEPSERACAVQMHNNELELTYREFVRRWPLRGPVTGDSPYRKEAAHLMRELQRQLAADLAEVEALLRAARPRTACV